MRTRQKISLLLKLSIGILSLLGTVLACLRYEVDGYSHWHKRLLYFTQLSNIWIGVLSLFIVIATLCCKHRRKDLIGPRTYLLRYVFTVSIALTGLIFCALLAPFAGDDYNAWTFPSLLTHVAVPLLAIADFFVDDFPFQIKKTHTVWALIPPFLYFVFASILGFCQVDFGRGDPYPYFFMNLRSRAGVFGFYYEAGQRPELGLIYWLIFLLLIIFGMAMLFYKLHPLTPKCLKKH